jgi:hypothetical protein
LNLTLCKSPVTSMSLHFLLSVRYFPTISCANEALCGMLRSQSTIHCLHRNISCMTPFVLGLQG